MSTPAAAALTPAPGNRRLAPRLIAMRDGHAYRPDSATAIVLIVDLSEEGARIRVRGGQVLPDDFVLSDPLTWLAHRAQVIWRRDAEVGVRLVKSQSLRGPIPDALKPSRDFCEQAER